jgi:hypothetical protein
MFRFATPARNGAALRLVFTIPMLPIIITMERLKYCPTIDLRLNIFFSFQ